MIRFFTLLSLIVIEVPGFAENKSSGQKDETTWAAFVRRFVDFAQSQNVVGKPKDAHGNFRAGGPKRSFDRDDGLPYQSDLTYHDLSVDTVEVEPTAQGQTVRRLPAFISPHGALRGADGASKLEIAAYRTQQKFLKEDPQQGNAQKNRELGIRFEGAFEQNIRDLRDENGQQYSLERTKLRDESRKDIDAVGSASFDDVQRRAKSPENRDKADVLANGVLLRYAASEGTQALWNSTLANLTQRRIAQGVQSQENLEAPKLSESEAGCTQWADSRQRVLASLNDPSRRQRLSDDIERMKSRCKLLAAIPFAAIAPRIETDAQGRDTLVSGNPVGEDSFQRDMRVQLGVLNRAGSSANRYSSEWKYDRSDDDAPMTVDFVGGQPQAPRRMTVAEQLESYNVQLREAAKGMQEVQKKMGGVAPVNPDAILAMQIRPESESVMAVQRRGLRFLADELGTDFRADNTSSNYNDLTGDVKKSGSGPVQRSPAVLPVHLDPTARVMPRAAQKISIQER